MRWGRALVCAVLVVAGIPLVVHQAAAACGLSGVPTATVYLPNVTKTLGGPSGWVTPFIVQNVGSAATTLEVSFYDFVTGSLVACRQVAGLAPQTAFAYIPNSDSDLPDGSAFSVVIRAFGSEIVAVVNEHQGEGAGAEAMSYAGISTGATRVGLPWVARADDGWLTTFIVQNLGTAAAAVTATFTKEDGTAAATLARSVESGRSWAVNPANEPGLSDATSYAVLLVSDQPIGVIANGHNDAPSAPQPMAFSYNGAPLSTGETHVPWVARNAEGARYTTVAVQNLGTTDAQPLLIFRRINGTEQATVQLGSLRPGQSARYTLPPASPNCPVDGTPICPREGEHAMTVAGGSFGVLAYSLSQSAVMGGTGSSTSSSRVYLPNVTRTLGGELGWTTPIVIQSAGATTGFLRWYRFADGQLAVTQYVGDLMPGASVKIDPREVPELVDGSQYSVVIEANGPLRAAVLELSSAGGDGAMAYEGFVSTDPPASLPTLASISLEPAAGTVTFGSTRQFVAIVRDQFGNPVTGVPLTWAIDDTNLGSVTSAGLFTASAIAGTATIRVVGPGLTATAHVSVAPETQSFGSQTFKVIRSSSADLYLEQTITGTDAQTVIAVVDEAVAYVQGAFARPFAERPAIYLFPDAATVTAGYYTALGGVNTPPTNFEGFFVPASGKIAVDWGGVTSDRSYGTIRHELAHKMEYQITRRIAGQVPVWFIEGLAAMHDLTEPESAYEKAWTRYTTASNAAAGRLFATVVSDAAFRELGVLEGNVAYAESAETVRLMYDDLGTAGVILMLEQVGSGKDFATAYQVVAGRPLDAFLTEKGARLVALASAYPGVVTTTDSAVGPGLACLGYGFPANVPVTFTITGAGYLPQVVTYTTNSYGVVSTYLSGSWAPGTYTFTLTHGGVSTSTTGVVTANYALTTTAESPQRSLRHTESSRLSR